jgi:hypothetical protein
MYHAFENGRVGVATVSCFRFSLSLPKHYYQRNGIFIVIPHPSFFSSAPLSSASPPPSVLRVHALNEPFILENVSCLQMTETGLFVTWSPDCLLTRNFSMYPESLRRDIYADLEDMFWRGLEEPVVPTRERESFCSLGKALT